MTWYYPSWVARRAPRRFHCSDCGTTIERGSMYQRANHGRYCHSCADKQKKATEQLMTEVRL